MKKCSVLIIILILCFVLTSCNNEKTKNNFINENSVSEYMQFLEDVKNTQEDQYYYIKDIDGDTTAELLLLKNTELSIYTIEETVMLVDSYDFITGTVRFFVSDDISYPGIFYFTVGGGIEHYGYITIKDKKLSFENLWKNNYSSIDTSENTDGITELSENKGLIAESQLLYNNNCDIPFVLVR